MRKLFYGLILVIFPAIGFGQNSSPLETTDGYFQAGNSVPPIHLVHPAPYPPQWVYPDDSVHIWYTIAVRQGEKSPCDRRSQTQCETTVSFVSLADPKYGFHLDGNFRIEDKLEVSYSIPIDREKTPLGAGKFVWTIHKDGKVLFTHEIFVEVK